MKIVLLVNIFIFIQVLTTHQLLYSSDSQSNKSNQKNGGQPETSVRNLYDALRIETL